MPFALRERSYSCKSQWNSSCNSSTSTTCNPIYSEGTILELQITMEFHQQLIHQHHLQSHLHCGNDPTVANHNGILSTTNARNTGDTPFTMRNRSENDPSISDHDPTTHETVSQPSHRRGRSSKFGDGLCMEKHRLSCICYLSKTHFVRDFLRNSIGNSSTSTTCNPIYSEGTILYRVANHNGIPSATHPPAPLATPFTMRERSYSCKSQWNSVDRTCTKNRWHPIYNAEPIREWSDHDPSMIPPHTRPSRNRRTAEVDHRGSGTDFVWKNIGFRASAISQKRISCETSFKTPSATPPPAPLACNPICSEGTILELQITMEFHQQLIHQHHLQPIYNAGTILQLQITMEFCRPHMHEKQVTPRLQCGTDPRMIRPWSEHDPTTHETVSQPSHRRGRSSRFGDGLCMEKHRLSCICYLSKTHFVRDFLQNSIGNSSTSTTCNPIYIAGTISLTNSFPNELFLC